jgi:hypothetical protein
VVTITNRNLAVWHNGSVEWIEGWRGSMRLATIGLFSMALLVLAGCGIGGGRDGAATPTVEGLGSAAAVALAEPLPVDMPPLPFADNPDPRACGIPRPWGKDDPATLTGMHEGELVQPVVFLYDSHLRASVVGQIPHGGRVQIVLYQSNPVLDYYLVRSLDLPEPQEGWVPAPFVHLG